MLQSELPSNTGMSKSTISRLLTELEKQNVIERESYGRSYLIRLSDSPRMV
ncbi:MAG: helix-turn-helix transcriptional regulator [Candidatus Hodarchaeales archaeon]